MKYFGLFILALVLASCSGSESEVIVGNRTSMEVTPTLFEAGDVIKGEMIDAKFIVKNTGNYPLVLAEVKGGCSCTVADYPDEPIQPGESGAIMAHINTNEVGVGPLSKGVNILANTEPSKTTVIIRASVMRK